MSDVRRAFGLSGLALLPLCCLGVPLLIAAGISAAALALVAGITVAAIACAAAVALLIARRPEAKSPWRRQSPEREEELMESGVTALEGRPPGRPLVEILSFAGCPNHLGAIELVERVSGGLGLDPEIRVLDVPDQKAAQRLRFLGSPTIRVGGHDIDPHAEERNDYALSCRLFRTEAGVAGQPDERWVRDALLREAADG